MLPITPQKNINAPVVRFELTAFGFGDRCATNYATPTIKKPVRLLV